MQAGFGPFAAVLLGHEKWTQQNIGYVLSVSGLAGLFSQLPGGKLLDARRSKRFLVPFGAILVAVSALVLALRPILPIVFAAFIADLTNGTGKFNLAQGFVGTFSGIGASLSTALFGIIAGIR